LQYLNSFKYFSSMKKPLKIVIIVLIVILAAPVISFVIWTFQPRKQMTVLIMDKTVPTISRDNHRSFVWILTNGRFVKKNKMSYSYKKDYYGFSPTRPLRDKKWATNPLRISGIPDIVPKTDALYYTDTYGVYFNDWYPGINQSRRSTKMYGGLLYPDYLYIVEMQRNNKLCILEYNTFDYPTQELDRVKTQDLILGIKCTGWTAKYYQSLDTVNDGTVPTWITALYRRQFKTQWTFTKPGMVFLKGNKIFVLEEGTHLKSGLPLITTDSIYREKYGITDNVGFQGWIDVIDPLKSPVISNYNLSTTALGDSLLYENFLTNKFPAVTTDTLDHRTYYFAGDFANNNVDYWTSRFKGVERLRGILYTDKPNDPRRFFWRYYRPLVDGIFNDYYKQMKAAK
jgi:hypothetical protein